MSRKRRPLDQGVLARYCHAAWRWRIGVNGCRVWVHRLMTRQRWRKQQGGGA